MRKYEIMLVIKPDKVEDAVSELDLIKSFIEDGNGGVEEAIEWGVRDLAYQIGDYDHADYRVWQVSLPGDQVKPLEEKLRLADYLIRYLIIKKE